MLKEEDLSLIKTALPFWEHLSPEDQLYLTNHVTPITMEKGQLVHSGDCKCIGVLIIKSGELRIYITSVDGREVTLYRLDDEEVCILSASCILETITFDVSISAETPCELLQICPYAFAQLAARNVYVELFSYKLTTSRFSDVMFAMELILFASFDKRLASFLIDECEKKNTYTLSITHEQIAKYTGSAREVVSRMLKYFSTEGYVSLSRGTITILNQETLLSLATML